MEIIVNGTPAVVAENLQIEYNIENPAFSGADDYSLSISFPLKDCEKNIAIFGYLTRKDIDTYPETFNCLLLDHDFSTHGILVIIEVTETEVKAQFLGGKSQLNYKNSFDDIYINSFTYGESTIGEASAGKYGSQSWKDWFGSVNETHGVALPWVYNDSDSGAIQNTLTKNAEGFYMFNKVDGDIRLSSRMPYLLWITKELCNHLGYTYKFTEWENSPYKHLVIANPIPAAWYETGEGYVNGTYTTTGINDYSYCLPKWTVAEFFDELGLLLNGEFKVNHFEQTVIFHFTRTYVLNAGETFCSEVVDSYSVGINEDPNNDYKGVLHYKYDDRDSSQWNYLCCPWFVNSAQVTRYETLQELKDNEPRYIEANPVGLVDDPRVLYAADIKTYFIMTFSHVSDYEYDESGHVDTAKNWFELRPINQFAPSGHSEDNNYNVLRIQPALIDETEANKFCIFATPENITGDAPDDFVNTSRLTSTEVAIAAGENDTDKPVAYDSISVAFWDPDKLMKDSTWQTPIIDSVHNLGDWNVTCYEGYSLRLTSKPSLVTGVDCPIDAYKLYKFSFLSEDVPNIKSVFFIHGKKYICAKLTLTFTDIGRSKLIKGEFYRIID